MRKFSDGAQKPEVRKTQWASCIERELPCLQRSAQLYQQRFPLLVDLDSIFQKNYFLFLMKISGVLSLRKTVVTGSHNYAKRETTSKF